MLQVQCLSVCAAGPCPLLPDYAYGTWFTRWCASLRVQYYSVPQLYLAFRSHLDACCIHLDACCIHLHACCIHLHACSHSASTVHFADGYGRHNYTQQEAEAEVMQWATLKLPLDVFGLDVSAP